MPRRQNHRLFHRASAPAPAAAGHRPLLLAVALAAGFSGVPALAQPSGAQAVVGSATLSQQGSRLLVTTTNGAGGYSSINWQSFSVPGGTSTYFAQPTAASTSINRVVGSDPSLIYGTLGSNGRLVLVNPAGITVGAGAVVDTAAFTASTLRMTDADLLNGRLRFGNGLGSLLKVDGTVLASQGDVVLIGQKVETGPGALVQSQGATVLAAGQKVEITGRGVEGIVFEVQAPTDRAVNLGTLRGDAVGVFAGTLRHSGLVQATAVSSQGGKVVLRAIDTAETSGAIVAQGLAGAGGSVDVLGDKVGVLAGASITTSNTAGGGRIRVGGDYQGANPDVPNASVTYVDRAAALHADATGNGDGGKVIVWADDTTRAFGTLSANAGPQGGNGGLVETSGKRYLDANGARVSASAARGAAGTWLLDPEDMEIIDGPAGGGTYVSAGGGTTYYQSGGGLSQVTDQTLEDALNAGSGTNVLVTTKNTIGSGSGNITFTGPVSIARTASGSGTLTIDAAGDINFNGNTSFQATGGAGRTLEVRLAAGAGSSIHTSGGSTVLLATDHADSDVKVRVMGGRHWVNDGTLTLNQNGQVLLDDAGTTGALHNAGTINGAAGARGGIGGSDTKLGWLENNGTLDLEQGAIRLNTLTQTNGSAPGTFQYGGGGSLSVLGGFDVSVGKFAFTGRDMAVRQDEGTLTIASIATIAASGGNVSLAAPGGSVQVDGSVSTNKDLTITAGNAAMYGQTEPIAAIDLKGSLAADRVALEAWGYDGINQTLGVGGGITANELQIYTQGDAHLAEPANRIGSLSAAVRGLDLVNTAATLTIRALPGNPLVSSDAAALFNGAVRGDETSGISIGNTGNVNITGALQGGAISVTATGDIVSSATISTYGQASWSGDVELAAGGKVDVKDIETSPLASQTDTTRGGSVRLTGTSVTAGTITTSGYTNPVSFWGGDAGNVTVGAGSGGVTLGNIVASGGSGGASYGAGGGSVTIASAGGAIQVGSITAKGGSASQYGGSGGDVTLFSGGGSITSGAIDLRGGDATTFGSGGSGGSVLIQTSGAGSVVIQGNVTTRGGDGADGGGHGGSVWIDNVGTLAAGSGSVTTQAIDTSGGGGAASAYGGSAGGITVLAGGGVSTAVLTAVGSDGVSEAGSGGDVRIQSGTGSVTVNGVIDTHGGSAAGGTYSGWGGGVSIGAASGAVTLGNVSAYGGSSADSGSDGGDIEVSSAGGIQAGSIDARGGSGRSAGHGGWVALYTDGNVSAGSIDTSGGSSTSGGTLASAGGAGGIYISSGGSVTTGSLLANGGQGGTYGAGGGYVDVLAEGNVAVNGSVETRGGNALDAYGLEGGYGGGVSLGSATGSVTVTGSIETSGGSANANPAGAGGWAGRVKIAGNGTTVGGGITAVGGSGSSLGGYGGSVSLAAGSGSITVGGAILTMGGGADAGGGVAGSGRNVELSAAKGISVGGVDTSAGLGGNGVQGNSAGNVNLLSDGNSSLQWVEAQGALGLGTVYNGGAGVLRDTGTYYANLYNEAGLAPGSTNSPIGRLTIAGDYTQTASGRLLIDVAAGATSFIPGVTYDQLQVLGTTTLDGALEVTTVALPPAPAPRATAFALAVAAPTTTPTVVLLDSTGPVTGSFSSVTAPAAFTSLLSMGSGGALSGITVTNVVLPPPPPAPVPAPAPAPVVDGSPLVQRIYQLLQQDVPRNVVQQALSEQDTLVTRFVSLLLKEEQDQANARKEQGKPDIVLDDKGCKPA